MLVIDDGWQTVSHDDGSGVIKDIVADAGLAAVKNEPTQASEDHSWAAKAVGNWYKEHVEGAPLQSTSVRLWRLLTSTVLRGAMADFFDKATEFSKRCVRSPPSACGHLTEHSCRSTLEGCQAFAPTQSSRTRRQALP